MELLIVELNKLIKKRNTKIFLSIYTVIFFGLALVYVSAEKMFNLSIYSGTQFVGASLSTMMAFMLPLLAIYFSGQSQAIDFTRGAMKNMYLLPISRTKIFVSKILAVWVIIGATLVGQFIFSLLISAFVDGVELTGFGRSMGQYLGAMVVLGLVGLIGNLLVLLLKNTGLSIIIAYAVYVGLSLVSVYVPMVKSISITTVISNYHMLFNFTGLNVLLSTLAYYIIVFIVGWLLFEKKEESLCQFD
jgi:ABC-2 type transport system permease protein